MLEQVVRFIMFFLSIYGAFCMLLNFISLIKQRTDENMLKTKLVIILKNQEETVEGIVRTIFNEQIFKKVMSKDRLTVVDMGSKDRTVEILKKLKREYEYIDVFTKDEKDKVFEEYENGLYT